MKHDCGCLAYPEGEYDRCDKHRYWNCHSAAPTWSAEVCPPCYLARLRSVHVSPTATPTRSRG